MIDMVEIWVGENSNYIITKEDWFNTDDDSSWSEFVANQTFEFVNDVNMPWADVKIEFITNDTDDERLEIRHISSKIIENLPITQAGNIIVHVI